MKAAKVIYKTFRQVVDTTKPNASVLSDIWLAKQAAIESFREWLKATNQTNMGDEVVEMQMVPDNPYEVDITVAAHSKGIRVVRSGN